MSRYSPTSSGSSVLAMCENSCCVELHLADDAESVAFESVFRRLGSSLPVSYRICLRVQFCLIWLVVLTYIVYVAVVLGAPKSGRVLASCDPEDDREVPPDEQHKSGTHQERSLENRFFNDSLQIQQKLVRMNNINASTGCHCVAQTCVRKCCPVGQRLVSPHNTTCAPDLYQINTIGNKIFYKLRGGDQLKDLRRKDGNESIYLVQSGLTDCSKHQGLFGVRHQVQGNPSFLMEDGSLLTQELLFLDMDDYCIDHTLTSLDTVWTITCDKVTLLHDAQSWMVRGRSFLEWLALILSELSLLATLVVHLYVPHLHSLHGKMLIGFIICLFVNYFQYFLDYRQVPVGLGYLWQYSYLGLFTWLTAIFYDLWILFRGTLRPRSHGHQEVMLLGYSLFAWGLPALLVAITWMARVVPNLLDACPRPRYRDDSCRFTMEATTRLFLNVPVAALATLCLLLYLSTLFNSRRNPKLHVQSACSSPCSRTADTAKQWLLQFTKVGQVVVVSSACLLVVAAPHSATCAPLVQPLTALYFGQGLWLSLALCVNRRTFRQLYFSRLPSRMG